MRECATLTEASSLIHHTAHRRNVSFDVPAGMRRAALNSGAPTPCSSRARRPPDTRPASRRSPAAATAPTVRREPSRARRLPARVSRRGNPGVRGLLPPRRSGRGSRTNPRRPDERHLEHPRRHAPNSPRRTPRVPRVARTPHAGSASSPRPPARARSSRTRAVGGRNHHPARRRRSAARSAPPANRRVSSNAPRRPRSPRRRPGPAGSRTVGRPSSGAELGAARPPPRRARHPRVVLQQQQTSFREYSDCDSTRTSRAAARTSAAATPHRDAVSIPPSETRRRPATGKLRETARWSVSSAEAVLPAARRPRTRGSRRAASSSTGARRRRRRRPPLRRRRHLASRRSRRSRGPRRRATKVGLTPLLCGLRRGLHGCASTSSRARDVRPVPAPEGPPGALGHVLGGHGVLPRDPGRASRASPPAGSGSRATFGRTRLIGPR